MRLVAAILIVLCLTYLLGGMGKGELEACDPDGCFIMGEGLVCWQFANMFEAKKNIFRLYGNV